MLRPIPVALASCTRFFEAMSAMRESFATLQKLRVGDLSPSILATPNLDPPEKSTGDSSDCVTPPAWRNESSFDDLALRSLRGQETEQIGSEDGNGEGNQVDGTSHRRLSWPPGKRVGV